MKRISLDVQAFRCDPVSLWSRQWLLLGCGDFAGNDCNAMTVGWGSIGTMWGKPFAMAVVRPQRYSFGLMEKYDTFTLCAFPESCRAALKLCGSLSGRDGNKFQRAGISPEKSSVVAAPSFQEAELVIECRKIYADFFRPEGFLPPEQCAELYPGKDIHKIYFGEIVALSAAEQYKDDAYHG